MPSQKTKIDYMMFKSGGQIIKLDPDIYYRIFNFNPERPNRKYNDGILCVHMSTDGCPVVLVGKNPYRYIPLARFVTNAKKGQIVDHRNRDPGDNRRCNLRFVTRRQNNLNKKPCNDTGFFGVCVKHQDKRAFCCGKFQPAGLKEVSFQLPDNKNNRIVAAFARDKFVLQAKDEEYAPLNFPCWQFEPFRNILLNEDLRKYKTERSANCQLEFRFMKNFKK